MTDRVDRSGAPPALDVIALKDAEPLIAKVRATISALEEELAQLTSGPEGVAPTTSTAALIDELVADLHARAVGLIADAKAYATATRLEAERLAAEILGGSARDEPSAEAGRAS